MWGCSTGHVLTVGGPSGQLERGVVGLLGEGRILALPGSVEVPFVSAFPGIR
jgi:hypothetical protein